MLLKAFRHSGATTSTQAVIRYPDFMKNLNTHLQSLTNTLTETEKKRWDFIPSLFVFLTDVFSKVD